MPIINTDIKFYLSGGAANADPNAALGGAISANEIEAGLHNLFDQVGSAESSAGDTEYRCIYVKNTHGSITLQNAAVFVHTESPSSDTDEEIATGTAAIGGTEQTVANESTAPSGVSWSQANGAGAALAIGDLAPGEWKAIWIKRVVSVGAAAYNNDGSTLRVIGDTAA